MGAAKFGRPQIVELRVTLGQTASMPSPDDTERWYPATVMGREEDVDGRIAHQVEYDGYPDRWWWHMLDDEWWRAVPEQAGTGAGGAAADVDGDAAMDRADGEGARAVGDAEAAEVRPAPPPVRRGVRRSALADVLEAEDDERQDEAVGKKEGSPAQSSISLGHDVDPVVEGELRCGIQV